MKKSYTILNLNVYNSINKSRINNDDKTIEINMLPGKQIIHNLINYSKSLDIINLQVIGKVNIIAN